MSCTASRVPLHSWLLFLFLILDASNRTSASKYDFYAIVVDCGSSGSRAHVFAWTAEGVRSLEHIHVFRVSPGISSFVQTYEAWTSIHSLLKETIDSIPAEKRDETMLLLKATAGIRSLPWVEATERVEKIGALIKENFPFRVENGWVSIISGFEEGLYAWLAMGHSHDFFTEKLGDSKRNNKKKELFDPFVVMDLGGSSAQIAWVVQEEGAFRNVPVGRLRNVGDSGANVAVSVVSFAGYGTQRARETVMDSLRKKYESDLEHNKEIVVENPCGFRGSEEEIDGISFRGTGSFDECRDLIASSDLFNGKLMFDDPAIPPEIWKTLAHSREAGDVVVVEGYSYISSFLRLAPSFTPESWSSVARNACNMDWAALQVSHDGDMFLKWRCFESAYVDVLWSEHALKVPQKEVIRTGSASCGWTMGALLDVLGEENAVPFCRNTRPSYALPVLTISIMLFMMFFLYLIQKGFWHRREDKSMPPV